MEGWISLHRSIDDHWLYPKNRPFTEYEAWIDILLQVNHKDNKTMIGKDLIDCKRGQSIKSLLTWSIRWSWSKNKVRRFFDMLKNEKMIVTENVQKTTRLTVCNYESYQGLGNDDGTQTERKRDTNNNDNNIYIEKKLNPKPITTKPAKKEFVRPTLEEVKKYFIEKGSSDQLAEKAFNHYDAGDWIDSKGNKVVNWKQKMLTNWISKNPTSEYKKEEPKKYSPSIQDYNSLFEMQ